MEGPKHPGDVSLPTDWEPRSPAVLQNYGAVCDQMRLECPVAFSEYLGWSLFRHEDICRVLKDTATFSNVVSAHLTVPNGMDPPLHTKYRRIIEPYFSAARMERFEPVCREVAVRCVESLPSNGEVDLSEKFARKFALDVQCAFAGWPTEVRDRLQLWMAENHRATLAGDREASSRLATEFAVYVTELLAQRRIEPQDDVTTLLLKETVDGRLLTDDEIVSILRNWTVGELGTIASAVGILVHYLCQDQVLQARLRRRPEELSVAIEEILRLDAPLLSNRRKVLRCVKIGERELEPGARVALMWGSANRDESVFCEAAQLRLERSQGQNLLYGAGIHVCPGAPLARLELRVVLECLLAGTVELKLSHQQVPIRAIYPAAGFATLPIVVERCQTPDERVDRRLFPSGG